MGIIKRGILGGFSKKVGNVVGGSWKGIAYMRSQPLSVANPRTTAQVAQRAKMTAIVDFAKPILGSFIKPFWDRFAVKMSGYNAFVMTNISLYDPTNPSGYLSMVLSKGDLGETLITGSAYDISTQVLALSWDTTLTNGFQSLNDEVYIVLVNAITGVVQAQKIESLTRATGEVNVTIPNLAANISDHVFQWLAFRSVDGFRVGTATVAVVGVSA